MWFTKRFLWLCWCQTFQSTKLWQKNNQFSFFWQLQEKCQISKLMWDNFFTTYKDAYAQTLFISNKMSTWFLNNNSNRNLTFNKIQIVKLTHFTQINSKILWSKWYWMSIRVKPFVFLNFYQERFATYSLHVIYRCYLIILKVKFVQYSFWIGFSFSKLYCWWKRWFSNLI